MALACARPPPAAAPASERGFYILPYLQNPTVDGVSVLWWTEPMPGPHQLEYGADFATRVPAQTVQVAVVGKQLHRARISGHRSAARGSYRVRSGALLSPTYTFHTASAAEGGFRLAVLGDGRTDTSEVIARHQALTRLAASRRPLLAVQVGDVVGRGELEQWERFWRRVATSTDPSDPGPAFASQVPYLLAVGNHELSRTGLTYPERFGGTAPGIESELFRAFVENPLASEKENPVFGERYFAADFGPATLLVLDTNNTSRDDLDNHGYLADGATPDWHPGSPQHDWLVGQLARAKARSAFTFVLMHPSPFSSGYHGRPDDAQTGYPLRSLDPLFRQYGVDAVISSHDHLVERSLTRADASAATDDGDEGAINYFVNGNGGHSTREAHPESQRWMTPAPGGPAFSRRWFYDWPGSELTSYLEVDVQPSDAPGRWRATFRTLRSDGEALDPVTLERAIPLADAAGAGAASAGSR